VKKTSILSVNHYLAINEKNIEIRKRVEDSWKTLSEIIFYSIVILSIPFFIYNLQESRLYYYIYIALLAVFLVSNIVLLSIKEKTDKLILKK